MFPEPANAPNAVKMATGYMGNRGDYERSWYGNTQTGNFLAMTGIHSDGSNFAMGDGHAKWLRGDQVSSGYQVEGGAPPACDEDDGQSQYVQYTTAACTANSKWAATFSPY
jgi:prepilin-type processing-associated H-X9-DG protein